MRRSRDTTETTDTTQRLRFDVGTRVLCRTGEGWEVGQIVAQWYHQRTFPPGYYAPYQVQLFNGPLIFVPKDSPQVCKELLPTWWEEVLKAAGENVRPRVGDLQKAASQADVNEPNYLGETALLVCANNGWDTCVRVLLSMGAGACVNDVDESGRTALLHAVQSKRATPEQVASMVEALLMSKADPNTQDIDLDRDPEFSSTSFKERYEHRTALHYCAASDYMAAAQLLLKAQANPNIIDGEYKTPLHLAIGEESSIDLVKLLLASRADPDKGNIEIGMQSSCLVEVARTGDKEVAAALIDARANINIVGKQGMTPLHMAVRCRKGSVAMLLVEAGCDTSARAMGKTAGELALTNGDASLARLLGADCESGPASAAGIDGMTEAMRRQLYLE